MKLARWARLSRLDKTIEVKQALDWMADNAAKPRMHIPIPPPPKPRAPTIRHEANILKAVLECLRYHPKVARVWRQNAGTLSAYNRDGSERFIRMGATGISDVIGFLKGGRFLACEVKAPGKNPTAQQQEFLDSVNRAGGLAFVARSVDDVMAALQ